MKPVIMLCLLFGACSVPAFGGAADDLQLRVELTKGERSKDSSSRTTTISIEPRVDTIVWKQTSSGYHGPTGAPPPSRKEYRLSPAERQKLIALIESKNLLMTKSMELPKDPSSYSYFVMSITSSLGARKGAISIRGPRTAVQVKAETLYQDSIALVKELYRIINSQGESVSFEELVVAKRTYPPRRNHAQG